MTEVLIGLELFEGNKPSCLDHAKVGVLSNSASLDSDLNFTWQVVDRVLPGQIKALFSPQHGYYADAQANIHAEYLQSQGDLSYVILDIDPVDIDTLRRDIEHMDETIRLRILTDAIPSD